MGATLERFCVRDGLGCVVRVSFADALQSCVDSIPRGKVATCGTLARALGDVKASRAVAQFLRDHPGTPSGHRVVRADGRPVLPEYAPRLREELVVGSSGRVSSARILGALPEVPVLRELREEQRQLARHVVEEDRIGRVERFGGADVSYIGDRAFAVAVTVDAETLEPMEIAIRQTTVDFPYIPTYLAFRELPAIRPAIEALKLEPDVLFVDGHGRLHPRRFGFACYAGVSLDLPTVGIAKHRLVGHPMPPNPAAKDAAPIRLDGSVEGYAWRPAGSSRPIYISVGHRVSLKTALALTRRATRRRYPEPLRIADRISKEERKKNAERSASERTAEARPPAQGPPGI